MPPRSGLVWKDPPGADDRRGFCHHYARAREAPPCFRIDSNGPIPANERARHASAWILWSPVARRPSPPIPDTPKPYPGRRYLVAGLVLQPAPNFAAASPDAPMLIAYVRYPNRAATARNRVRAVSSSSAMVAAISAGGGRLAGSVAPSSRNHDRFRSRRSRAANSA